MAFYDVIFSRKVGGDPTMDVDTSSKPATSFNNHGFKDKDKTGELSVVQEHFKKVKLNLKVNSKIRNLGLITFE